MNSRPNPTQIQVAVETETYVNVSSTNPFISVSRTGRADISGPV